MKPESSGDSLIDLLMRGLGRLMPVEYASAVSDEQYQLLKQRNRWIEGISQALCLLGIVGGIFLPMAVRGRSVEFTGWDIGVQFGLGVALPVIYILLATVSQSRERLREFLVFYSLKYGVDARRLFLFGYTPIILFGFVSAYFSYFNRNV